MMRTQLGQKDISAPTFCYHIFSHTTGMNLHEQEYINNTIMS